VYRVTEKLDIRRIAIFLLFAFGIAWATGLVIYLTGGLVKSVPLGGGLTLALVLLATAYMGAPALANILTRLVTREGWKDVYLRPRFKQEWRFWLICWIAPSILVIVGMIVYFLLFPQYFDPTLGVVRRLLEQRAGGQLASQTNPWTVVISQAVIGVVIAPIVNALPVLGEEFGWRAYLQPKLMALGGRKTMVLMGIIWGVWHAPVILMGYEYGFNYPGATWLGCLVFPWFTFVFGTLIGWAALRASSVWPAVIGHGAINGFANIVVFFIRGEPQPLLGPAVNGIIGSIGFAVVALVIFLRPGALSLPASIQAEAVQA
jgi:membrane protease YdiL (CAAX protease family)